MEIFRQVRRYRSVALCALLAVFVLLVVRFTLPDRQQRYALCELLPRERKEAADFRAEWKLDLQHPQPHMRLYGDETLTGQLRDHARGVLHFALYTDRGAHKLFAAINATDLDVPGFSRRGRAFLTGSQRIRQPDGTYHLVRHVLIGVEFVPEGEERPTVAVAQHLEIDPEARTADPIPCPQLETYDGLPVQDFQCTSTGHLPEKFGGDAIPSSLQRLLYAMASIDSPSTAAAMATPLRAFAQDLVQKAPYPKAPWPKNWGIYEKDARRASADLTCTLTFLQENSCFRCAELAAFINSPLFAALFGTRFSQPSGGRVQETPIPFNELQAVP